MEKIIIIKYILKFIIYFIIGILYFFMCSKLCHAQTASIQDIQAKQQDIVLMQTNINNDNNDLAFSQARIIADNAAITIDNQEIAAYNASTAQTVSGVNWDYFVTLEPQIPFAQWSKINNGINWTSIVANIGINCGGITEANVNWTNWGTCEANGMTPGLPFGGKNTGIAAFWCGNGKITGTC